MAYICPSREEGKAVKKSPLDLLLIKDKYLNDPLVSFFAEDHITCFRCGGWGHRKYLCPTKRARKTQNKGIYPFSQNNFHTEIKIYAFTPLSLCEVCNIAFCLTVMGGRERNLTTRLLLRTQKGSSLAVSRTTLCRPWPGDKHGSKNQICKHEKNKYSTSSQNVALHVNTVLPVTLSRI